MSKVGCNCLCNVFNLCQCLCWVVLVFGLCLVLLVGCVVYVQIINSDFYQCQGEVCYLCELLIKILCGMIIDCNGELLVVFMLVVLIWVNLQDLLCLFECIFELVQVVGMLVDELSSCLLQKLDKEFMYLCCWINLDEVEKVVVLKILGVVVQCEFCCFYLQGEVMVYVLGFINIDDRGQEGLELVFDEWLCGKLGVKWVICNCKGEIVESDLLCVVELGKDLIFSIDCCIQYLVFKELCNVLVVNKVVGGLMVIMDVIIGEILVMVNLLIYNLNLLIGVIFDMCCNCVVIDLVELGLMMKLLIIVIVLQVGVVIKDIIIDINLGYMMLGCFIICDVLCNNGVLNVIGVIICSLNVGVVKVVVKMLDQIFYDGVCCFGYGLVLYSGFLGELVGVVMCLVCWLGIIKIIMFYGYGLLVMLLQIVIVYLVLVNGGCLIVLIFVKGQCNEGQQIIDENVVRQVVVMMEMVVIQGGVKQVVVLGYCVVGKIGIVCKVGLGGYECGYYNVLFVGVVLVINLCFVIVIVINDLQVGKFYGGLVLVLVYYNVMEGILCLMDVLLDDLQLWLVVQQLGKVGYLVLILFVLLVEIVLLVDVVVEFDVVLLSV